MSPGAKLLNTLTAITSLTSLVTASALPRDNEHLKTVAAIQPRSTAPICDASKLSLPILANGHITSLEANIVTHHTGLFFRQGTSGLPPVNTTDISFCNVTVVYTHPGWNDSVAVGIFLPLENWNGRFLGGFLDDSLEAGVTLGYAAANTNAGHRVDPDDLTWTWSEPGVPNMARILDFGSETLNDLSIVGKQITESAFGSKVSYSYFTGCSGGGRQAFKIAQKYPDAFDGIMGNCPALNWSKVIYGALWPAFIMEHTGVFPPYCVLDFISNATRAACDAIDGLVDGIVSAPGLCKFDPLTTVGQKVDCQGVEVEITPEYADLFRQIVDGPRSSAGEKQYWTLQPDAELYGWSNTTCTNTTDCTPISSSIPLLYFKYLLARNESWTVADTTYEDWDKYYFISQRDFEWVMDTNSADLSALKASGSKLLSWHGLRDQALPSNATREYYQKVQAGDENVADYFRYFEVPGVGHCSGGPGPQMWTAFDALVNWVENGVAPDVLEGTLTAEDGTTAVGHRPVCAFPLVAAYQGGDPSLSSSYKCQEGFGAPA